MIIIRLDMDRNTLLTAAGLGLALQLLLVITGHFVPVVADNLFALGGVAIAFAAGAVYGRRAAGARPLLGGATAGVAGAFVGILVSVTLGDVPAVILLVGTIAGALAGLAGAAAGRTTAKRAQDG